MANFYLYSGAGGSGNGSSWANAFTTLAAAQAAGTIVDGDFLFVASDHAESTAAAISITLPTIFIISVNRAGSVPPVAADYLAGAQVTTTGASNITLAGHNFWRGIIFNCGTGASAASINLANTSGNEQRFSGCSFRLVTTSTSSRINTPNGVGAAVVWEDCEIRVGNASQGIQNSGDFVWRNSVGVPAIAGATVPNGLIAGSLSTTCQATYTGLDLSALPTLVTANVWTRVQFLNCKLGASTAISSSLSSSVCRGITLRNCSRAGVALGTYYVDAHGTIDTETTIARMVGATDGTTSYSLKFTTTSNISRTRTLVSPYYTVTNLTPGRSVTLEVHTLTDNVTLTNADIWIEIEYMGTANNSGTTTATTAPATLMTAGTNLTSVTETWITTGLTTPVKQKMQTTFTPMVGGNFRYRIVMAKASATAYVCPMAEAY